jgi:hypothetical protein
MVVSAIVGSDVATSDPIGEVEGSYRSIDACGARVMEAAVGPKVGAMVVSAIVVSDVVTTGDPLGDVMRSYGSTDAAGARVVEAI